MTSKVKLADVAIINPRLTERPSPQELISFLGMADVDAERGTTTPGQDRTFAEAAKGYTQFVNGDILVAKITPCFENGKIAQAKLRKPHGAGSTEFHVIRPDRSALDDRYLLNYLRQPYIRATGERQMTGSAGQRRVPASFLSNLPIPLPTLNEQRRIASALDLVDELRVRRRGAIALQDNLTQAIFLDMFGATPYRWPLVTVESVAAEGNNSIRTGPFGSQLLHEEFVDSGIAVLGIDNVVTNEFRWNERRHITEQKYRQLARYTVRPGDVLITIMGTCGRCAIVPEGIPTAINTKHLCCITLDQSKCLPEFLHSSFLVHPDAKVYLHRAAKGAIMSGLNMTIIKALPMYLPPIEVQRIYAARVRMLHALKAEHVAHLAELDALFLTLQFRSFGGAD